MWAANFGKNRVSTMRIRNLFDSNKGLDRRIEKVITFASAQEERLKAEITEYIVTDNIEDQFRRLLDRMQLAMEVGGENEVGVWVSGFYGSGKSSFTKYLGFSFDENRLLDGVPFIKYLEDRFNTPQLKAQLSTVAKRYPAAVVMLDLASEQLAGSTMEDVSTVLYYKVLEWAGYSRNLKVAALEQRIERDERVAEFEAKVAEAIPGLTWKDLRNDPLAVDALIPQLAHEMYPVLFPTVSAFTSNTDGYFQFENERVQAMIEIIRRKSGKDYVLFVIDEVGQYIASRDNLILNLDGLAKNLKGLGNGKAWIIATAQQTLTEDDPRATLNSDKLYKLKDRFPIQIDLESSDIKEICYRRLLGKSPEGEAELGGLFDQHGQALRHDTKLKDAKFYSSDFDKTAFVNLYPFLPAHFDILLNLLGALAKSTGGVGLRSAIKVIQDILIEGDGAQAPAVADQEVGWLATTVTLYDAMVKDIRRAFPSINQAVGSTCLFYRDSVLHQEIAKSVAVLQILGNLPVTLENLAALMHPSVDASSRLENVKQAVDSMLNEAQVPLTEKDGSLSFLSEKLRDIDLERSQIIPRNVDVRSIVSSELRECFEPLPRATVSGSLQVPCGLKLLSGSTQVSLAGEVNAIQIIAQFEDASEYEGTRTAAVEESRQRQSQASIYLLGRTDPDVQAQAEEIYRCQRVAEMHRNDPDQEVRDYCRDQLDRIESRLKPELQRKLRNALTQGSFVFRGEITAVSALSQEGLLEAARKQLGIAAEQVFDRYSEAPVRAETTAAEKFLKQTNLASITSLLDPLGLVETVKGRPQIKTTHKAIVSIRDYIDRNGTVDGKRLSDHFGQPAFGWSADTMRYILAAMLVAGEITLKISGREVRTPGQQAIDALKTNKSFSKVGVSLRDVKPSIEVLSQAADRLTELTGDLVIPLEQDISKAAVKTFPQYQRDYGPLAERLAGLEVAGADRLRSLTEDLTDMLQTDASDAPEKLGAEDSALYETLKWAKEVKQALDNGVESTIRSLLAHQRAISGLPGAGIPGELRKEVTEDLNLLSQRLQREDFFAHAADLNTMLTGLKSRVRDTVRQLVEQQKQRIKEGAADLDRLEGWQQLTGEEQQNVLARLDQLVMTPEETLEGMRQLLASDYELNTTLNEQKDWIRRKAEERRKQELIPDEMGKSFKEYPGLRESISMPAVVRSKAQLDEILKRLENLRSKLAYHSQIEISIQIED